MKYPFPVVEITWLDAGTSHGWESNEEITAVPFEVMTIGFLLRDQPDCVMVASTVCPEKTCNGRITIPRGMVQSIRYLHGKARAPRIVAAAKTDPLPPGS